VASVRGVNNPKCAPSAEVRRRNSYRLATIGAKVAHLRFRPVPCLAPARSRFSIARRAPSRIRAWRRRQPKPSAGPGTPSVHSSGWSRERHSQSAPQPPLGTPSVPYGSRARRKPPIDALRPPVGTPSVPRAAERGKSPPADRIRSPLVTAAGTTGERAGRSGRHDRARSPLVTAAGTRKPQDRPTMDSAVMRRGGSARIAEWIRRRSQKKRTASDGPSGYDGDIDTDPADIPSQPAEVR
jgi:hypothetical protein